MNLLEDKMRHLVQCYNHDWYWKTREKILHGNYPKILKLWWLFRIKRSDVFNNASTGIFLGYGAEFITPPNLPHGLFGIIISCNAKVGKVV